MEYTVNQLAKIAGVSTRTLRYYDEMGILKPARINSSGYRIYGQKEVDTLQQILFYKELGVSLELIHDLITSPSFDELQALQDHREKLLEKKNQLERLIENVNKTILSREGRMKMKDQEKFEGFKKKLLDENEIKYGDEVRENYGDNVINQSNKKLKNMTKEQYDEITKLGEEVIHTFLEAYKTGNPASELAQKAADLHRKWLSFYWDHYTKEAHQGIAQMYVDDERFTQYYDQHQTGLTLFLRDAVNVYTEKKE